MALKLQNCAKSGYLNLLQSTSSRRKHTAPALGAIKSNETSHKQGLHASAVKSYPCAPSIPLPRNMTQIFGTETGRFTPERARDITGPVLIFQTNTPKSCTKSDYEGFICSESMSEPNRSDSYTDSYDCTGAVSLNSSMQSNVPQPFSSEGKSMHLNMPGGQWARDDKYIADDMQKSHYAIVKPYFNKMENGKGACGNNVVRGLLLQNLQYSTIHAHVMRYSTGTCTTPNESQKASGKSVGNDNDSATSKLKRAFKDYGSTVIVFHTALSLASLGTCYVAISSGIDVSAFVEYLGLVDSEKIQSILSNSSTFLISYAIHKLFAPVRIYITLATTPFLVRYLRKVGILKVKQR